MRTTKMDTTTQVPSKTVESENCHEVGHFANVCRSKTDYKKKKNEFSRKNQQREGRH